MLRSRALLGFALLGTLLASALGCREDVPPLFRRNRPPETTLTIVAEESTQAFYRYRVHWRGEDADGEVIRYMFAITDTISRDDEENWNPHDFAFDRERGVFTTKTDSVFLFNSAAGRQAFNIVAIDDFGAFDETPARAFFRVVDNGLPRIRFLDVLIDSDDPRLTPCASADSCTVSTFTDFQVRFTGTTLNGGITGYTWQTDPTFWEPFSSQDDTTFLELATVDGDTIAFDLDGLPRWTLNQGQDTVTVILRSSRENPLDPGNFLFRAKCRDQARLQSLRSRGERLITINFDPDTRLATVAECDCPTAPPGCGSQEQVPVGFITGIGEVDSFPLADWRIFCPGDTVPNLSRVRFYSTGSDDPRDLPIDPDASTLPEPKYRFRFEMAAPGGFNSANMPFSAPAQPALDLPLPPLLGGGTFRGAAVGWQTCPFDYLFQAGAVDEHGKIDGTPDQIGFFVGGSPTIDSVRVPKVFVFVPTCGQAQAPTFCPGYENVTFGPDTLAVFGRHVPDAVIPPWQTPFGLGWNDFVFPFKAWGHDHPRDQNRETGPPFYGSDDIGRIRSWRYSFDCSEPGCNDFALPGERLWRENRPGSDPKIDAFDDSLIVRIVLDTLCVEDDGEPGCFGQPTRAKLAFTRFGEYVFAIQGRDTEFIGQTCTQPSDLGATPANFPIDIAPRGRTTQVEERETVWLELKDVRPIQTPSAVSQRQRPFANRKRLMQ
ncbi:MAG: hypothetical protein JSW67_09510 [Candidatus Latescibacterota bacterium]|nr:MAG: hypothetical protein JSW67_09510 [Candidatus Latescibacterota bacterium]